MAGKDRGIRVFTVYSSVPYEPPLEALATGVEVVVGTPGRLIDLMNRRSLDISHVKSLVLDEADEMLDLGFLPDVERLLKRPLRPVRRCCSRPRCRQRSWPSRVPTCATR